MDISNNYFDGTLPLPRPGISYYFASNDSFMGNIPPLMCSASDLIALNLSNNSLSGTWPGCLINQSSNMSVLNLRMNEITGVIPEILGVGNILRTLDLSRNRFEGSLLLSLESCKRLEVLDLSRNRIEGAFPNWMDALPELEVFILRSNKFHGHMNHSDRINLFSKLRILNLSNTEFLGLLPRHYFTNLEAMSNGGEEMSYLEQMRRGQIYPDSVTVRMKGLEVELVRILSIFTSIDLSMNNIQGAVPAEIMNLKSLKGLSLSHNILTGGIPPSLGNLTNLEWLDLLVNMQDGGIPKRLAGLMLLSYLNLSKNRLVGEIPIGRQFNTFGSSSYDGNPGLCGFPLPKSCNERPAPSPDLESHGDQGDCMSWWKAALMGYCPGLVLGISLGYVFLETVKPRWITCVVYRI